MVLFVGRRKQLPARISASRIVDLKLVACRPNGSGFVSGREFESKGGPGTWIKQAVDEGRDQFIVTGSVASPVREGTAESAQGAGKNSACKDSASRKFSSSSA